MIELSLQAQFSEVETEPFTARLSQDERTPDHACLVGEDDQCQVFDFQGKVFAIHKPQTGSLIGDIIYAQPSGGFVSRWIRNDSLHNTLLITERCDQLCIMCSQPPKKTHVDLFNHFEKACRLAPDNMTIGLSGGEPLLYKEQVFKLIERTFSSRPDLNFHVLTNAQHFDEGDIIRLRSPCFQNVLWGVPLYSHKSDAHDEIVAKSGAFERLMDSFSIMARAGLNIELRTVMLKQNYGDLLALSDLVVAKLPFLEVWAIMQLERIGFAKNRWSAQFVDHSAELSILEASVSNAEAAGIPVALYNVPTCTVSNSLRPYLRQSISDWKRSYAKDCESCSKIDHCCGFFSWHTSLSDYQLGGAI